jgi:hypothetical protein
MGYTRRKIRGINFSFWIAAFVFACGATYCAWVGWPRGFRAGSAAGYSLFALASLLFAAFPAVWLRFPVKHPVYQELSRYGDFAEVSERLDREMAGAVEMIGPFRFTATLLIYEIFHEFQMVPYDEILSAKIEPSEDGEGPATTTIVVHTRDGRRYQWYRTFMQGRFDAEKVLARIRHAAHLDDPPPPAS